MTKFHMSLFDPIIIKSARKIDPEVLQGKIPAAALEEMFPLAVKLEPSGPEALKEEAARAPREYLPEEHWKGLLEKAACLHRESIDSLRDTVRQCYEILGRILETAPDHYGSDAAEPRGCGKKYPVTVENVPDDDPARDHYGSDAAESRSCGTGGGMHKESGDLPVCAAPDEVQEAFAGIPFYTDVVASDAGGKITGIEVVTLPRWAALEILTPLPSPDAIARISGTPGPEDKALHVMQVVATNCKGKMSSSLLKIKVGDYCFTEDQPGVL